MARGDSLTGLTAPEPQALAALAAANQDELAGLFEAGQVLIPLGGRRAVA